MEVVTFRRASLFKRVIAKVIDITLVFALFVIFDQFVVHPLANKLWDYDNLVTKQEEYMIEYSIGEYDENGSFTFYDDYDATEFENDVEVQALVKKINLYKMIQWCVDIFVPEILIMFVVPLLLKHGRSLGKLLMKIKVVNANGEDIKLLNLFLRFFIGDYLVCSLISVITSLPICPLISVVLMLVPPKHRSIMDCFGNTLVVEK